MNGPRILQLGYEDEEDSEVMAAFERVGSLVSFAGWVKQLCHPFSVDAPVFPLLFHTLFD